MKESFIKLIDRPVLALIVTVIYTFLAGPSLVKSLNPLELTLAIFLGIVILVWWLFFTHKFLNRNKNV